MESVGVEFVVMNVQLASLLAFGLCYAGMGALSLGMEKHHAQVWNDSPKPAQQKLLRASGWVLILLALVPSITGWNATVGIVTWAGMLSLGAIAFVLLLSYQPRIAAGLGLVLGLLSLGMLSIVVLGLQLV